MRTNTQDMASRLGYITEEEFLDLAGVTPVTAEAWRKRGQGPEYALLGNKYYYSYDAVAEALAGKERKAIGRRGGRPPKDRSVMLEVHQEEVAMPQVEDTGMLTFTVRIDRAAEAMKSPALFEGQRVYQISINGTDVATVLSKDGDPAHTRHFLHAQISEKIHGLLKTALPTE